MKMRGCPVLEDQQHGRQRDDRPECHDPARRLQAGDFERPRQRVRGPQIRVRHESGRDKTHDDVNQRADGQPTQNADRHVPLRVLGFLRRGRNGIEADVREEHNRGPLVDAAPSVRRKRRVVGGIDVHRAKADEQRQHEQLDDHHQIVRACALLDADVEECGDRQNDQRGWNIQQNRDAGDSRRGVEQTVDRRIRAQKRGSVSVDQPVRKRHAKTR